MTFDPFAPTEDEPEPPAVTAGPASTLGADLWPALRWRGDLTRRHLTAGTILSVTAVNNGDVGEPGVSVSTVELELRRVAHKYRGRDSGEPGYGKTVNGDMIYQDADEIRAVIHGLVHITRALEYVDASGKVRLDVVAPEPGVRLRLTADGGALAESAYSAASRDRRFEHIDMSDPILELDVTSGAEDGSLVETLGVRESTLPLRRGSSSKPGYRAWLQIVGKNPITWAVLQSGLDPHHPLLHTDGALEGTAHIVAAFNAAQALPADADPDEHLPLAYWAARVQAEFIGPLAQVVLSGGPDGLWIGKPLKPDAVHADVVGLCASGVSGFGSEDEMERRSSLAWELFDAAEITLPQYTETREAIEAARADANTITVTHVPEVPTGDEADIDSDELDKRLSTASLTADKRGIVGGGVIEKLLMRKTADALFDSALGRAVANPWDAGKPGALLHVRCSYVVNAKDPHKRRSCDRWAVQGSDRCETHGGMYLDPEETKALLRAGMSKIYALSSKAIDTLGDLMVNSTNDSVRAQCAKMILDRAGFNEAIDINVDVGAKTEDPAEVIRERLRRLAPAAAELPAPEPKLFGEYSAIDAEVVEDPGT